MKKFTGILLAVALVFSLTACGGAEKETEPQTESVVETEAELAAYGEDVEGAWKVQIKNGTGADIKAIAVKKTADTEFPENILKEDEVIAADEEVILYYVAEAVEETEAADDAKALNDTYDVSITLADDTTYVLTAFPFDDMEACEIKVEDEVAFVEYVSVSTEEEISTKEAELAIKEAAETVVEEDNADDEYTYDAGTSGNSSVNQGSDECLGDDALTYDDPVDQGSDSCLGGAEVNTPSVDQGSDSCLGGAEVNTPSVDQGSDECLGDDAMTW